MEARSAKAHFGIEGPIKISRDGSRTWFVFVQGSLLTTVSACVTLFASLVFASIPVQLLTPEASDAFLAWLDRPLVFLKLSGLEPDLSFAVKRNIVNLGYTPIEVADTELSEKLTSTAEVNSSPLERETVSEDATEVTYENHRFLTFSRDEVGLAISYGEREIVVPVSAVSSENLAIALKGLIDATTSSMVPPTVFVGLEGKAALIRNYGIPYFENPRVNYLGTWLEDGKSPETVVLHTSLGKTFYLNKVVQKDRNKVVLDKTRILCYWDGIIIYSDGHISDISLNWRMKVSAAAPLDFLISEGILYLLDIAGNVHVLNLKNRRVLLTDCIVGAVSLSVVNNTLRVNMLHGAVVYSRDFTKKEYMPLQLREGMEPERISYFSKTTVVSPTILDLRQTAFGIFWQDTYLGEELHLLKIEKDKAQVFTEIGVWTVPLCGQNLQ